MSFELNALIDDAVVYGELSDGTDATWLAQRVDPRRVAVMANVVTERGVGKERVWTAEEDTFLREHYMKLSDVELAQALGRSVNGIHIRRERVLRITGRSKSQESPNMHEVARLLGAPCSKVFRTLMRRGILPGRRLPLEADVWVIERRDLLRFVVNPRNWIYFKIERVVDQQLRRLIELRRQMWGDEWWSPGQVAAYHGVSLSVVNSYIRKGKLPAVRWANWHILRSDAQRTFFRQGRRNWNQVWTERGDAFLILGRAVGFSWGVLAKLTGIAHPDARLKTLRQRGQVEGIMQRHGLAVQFEPVRGRMYADWRTMPGRFPFLEKAVERFLKGCALREDEARLLLGIMGNWLDWHATTDEQREEARRLQFQTRLRTESVRSTYERLVGWGFELK